MVRWTDKSFTLKRYGLNVVFCNINGMQKWSQLALRELTFEKRTKVGVINTTRCNEMMHLWHRMKMSSNMAVLST